jgi:predicted permease
MKQLSADLRYVRRALRHAPLFASAAVLSIALGIAANTTVFTLLDQVVLRRLPVSHPRELVQVHSRGTENYSGSLGDGTEMSYPMYRDLRDQNTVFSTMFCRAATSLHVGYRGRTEQVTGELVSGTFFPALGVRPAVGRLFDAREDRAAGAAPYAVLAFTHWQTRFNADPSIVGQKIVVNGHPLEIVGVAERGFAGLDLGQPVQIYVPVTMQPQMGPSWLELEGRRFRFVQAFARLRSGVSIAAAGAGLQPLYQRLLQDEAADAAFAKASPETKRRFLEGRLSVVDASRGHSALRDSVTEPLQILAAIAAGLLLIVCANVANLLLARGAARQRELAVRVAVGAARWHIVRLLLVESLVLAVAGGALGLLLASWGAEFLVRFYTTPETPIAVASGPDTRIVLFTVVAALLTAVAAGILPALRNTRVDLAPVLKSTGGAAASEQPRLRKALVVAQVAISLTLLVAAGLFIRSLENLARIDPGFRTTNMLSFGFDLSRSGYDAERAHTFMKVFTERFAHAPGVQEMAFSFQPLLANGGWGMDLAVEGYTPPPGDSANAALNAVSPGYFKTLGIPLVAGREFKPGEDRATALEHGWPYTVAIVNESFVKRYFKGANPLGRHLGIGGDPGIAMPIEIVGVVKDSKYFSIRGEEPRQVYFPVMQSSIESLNVFLHTSGDPSAVMPFARREIAAMDPNIAVVDVATLDERVDRSVVNERMVASLSTMLGLMATVLSVVGLYAVMAFTVTRRKREIGIRMALGENARETAGRFMREAGVLIAAGLAIGAGAAWWLGRLVQSQLYQVQPADSLAFLSAAGLLSTIAMVASLIPAWRAAQLTPMAALREE